MNYHPHEIVRNLSESPTHITRLRARTGYPEMKERLKVRPRSINAPLFWNFENGKFLGSSPTEANKKGSMVPHVENHPATHTTHVQSYDWPLELSWGQLFKAKRKGKENPGGLIIVFNCKYYTTTLNMLSLSSLDHSLLECALAWRTRHNIDRQNV